MKIALVILALATSFNAHADSPQAQSDDMILQSRIDSVRQVQEARREAIEKAESLKRSYTAKSAISADLQIKAKSLGDLRATSMTTIDRSIRNEVLRASLDYSPFRQYDVMPFSNHIYYSTADKNIICDAEVGSRRVYDQQNQRVVEKSGTVVNVAINCFKGKDAAPVYSDLLLNLDLNSSNPGRFWSSNKLNNRDQEFSPLWAGGRIVRYTMVEYKTLGERIRSVFSFSTSSQTSTGVK